MAQTLIGKSAYKPGSVSFRINGKTSIIYLLPFRVEPEESSDLPVAAACTGNRACSPLIVS